MDTFFLTLFCVFGKRNGAVQLVHLYEKDVQERAVSLGLITPERIRHNARWFRGGGMLLYIACLLIFVYAGSGAGGHDGADPVRKGSTVYEADYKHGASSGLTLLAGRKRG